MTPLILVAGFLGAGKTSFLRHVLLDARARQLRVGVIVNEFGSVDVDGVLLRERAQVLAAVAGGCACCAGQDDFLEAVETMADADFDAIIVEASGLADPLILLESLATPTLLWRVEVTRVVCVADASNWNATAGALGPLLRRQLALADDIVLNKTDLVGAQALVALQRKIAAINARAQVQLSVEGRAHSADLWSFAARENSPQSRASKSTAPDSAAPDSAASESAHSSAHTMWLGLPHPLERAELERALGELGENVWRAKGFVRLRGHDGLQLVQLSGGLDGARARIAPFAPPFGAPEPQLGLVFIGAALDEADLTRRLRAAQTGGGW